MTVDSVAIARLDLTIKRLVAERDEFAERVRQLEKLLTEHNDHGISDYVLMFSLSPTEARLFRYLMDHASPTLEQIEFSVWGGKRDRPDYHGNSNSNLVSVLIHKIRKKVNRSPYNIAIDNVRNCSYFLRPAMKEKVHQAIAEWNKEGQPDRRPHNNYKRRFPAQYGDAERV